MPRPPTMRRVLLGLGVALGLVLGLAPPGLADTVHLRNGSVLRGRVIDDDGEQIRVRVAGGTVTLGAHEVESIRWSETPNERYVDRMARIDREDPDALRELALWCRRVQLAGRAEELEELARAIETERLVESLPEDDPAPWFRTYVQTRLRGETSPAVQRWLLDRALRIDPDYAPARLARGDRWDGSRWVPPDEYGLAESRRREMERREEREELEARREELRRREATLEHREARARERERRVEEEIRELRERERRARAASRNGRRGVRIIIPRVDRSRDDGNEVLERRRRVLRRRLERTRPDGNRSEEHHHDRRDRRRRSSTHHHD